MIVKHRPAPLELGARSISGFGGKKWADGVLHSGWLEECSLWYFHAILFITIIGALSLTFIT